MIAVQLAVKIETLKLARIIFIEATITRKVDNEKPMIGKKMTKLTIITTRYIKAVFSIFEIGSVALKGFKKASIIRRQLPPRRKMPKIRGTNPSAG